MNDNDAISEGDVSHLMAVYRGSFIMNKNPLCALTSLTTVITVFLFPAAIHASLYLFGQRRRSELPDGRVQRRLSVSTVPSGKGRPGVSGTFGLHTRPARKSKFTAFITQMSSVWLSGGKAHKKRGSVTSPLRSVVESASRTD